MYHRIIATLALSFVFYTGFSQESYHRLYETTLMDTAMVADTTFFHMASTTNSGNVYAMGTKRVADTNLTVVFTNHDNKGNINWSRELDFGIDSVSIQSLGDFNFNQALDSILFTINVEINGNAAMIFGRMDSGGGTIDLYRVGGFELSSANARPLTAAYFGPSDLLLRPSTLPTINRVGPADSLIWSRSYEFNNTDGDNIIEAITDMRQSADSTFVISGTANNNGESFLMAKLDSNGVQVWAESYALSVAGVTNIVPTEIRPITGFNTAVGGTYQTNGGVDNGFVAVADTAGGIMMAKEILVDGNATNITNLIEGEDGSLWISGLFTKGDSTLYFTTNMTVEGTINWTTIYNQEVSSSQPFTTALLNVQSTGGATLVGHGFKDELEVLHVMKHNAEGIISTDEFSSCSDTITATANDLSIVTDTLTTTVINGGLFYDTLDFEFMSFVGFTPPVLNIDQQYPPFCPNEIIDTFLIASVTQVDPANVTYIWSTGEIGDTIRVFDEGQYSVTVTVNEDICFKMCDTIELTRYMLPQVAITQDNNQFCEEGIVVLTGNYTPGAPGQTYLWSTGEMTPSIDVTEAGLYSITVTDECGEIATDELEVSLPVFDPSVFFGANVTDFCNTGSAVLTAAYSGGGSLPVFTWSDGQTGNPIIVSTEGSYTVTVTDECDFNVEFTEEVVFPTIATEAEITFELNCNEENPSSSTVNFSATGNGDINLLTFVFNDDGTQTQVNTENPTGQILLNNFNVIVTNICGDEIASIQENLAAACGGLLRYPIAFFPGGQDEASRTFGPIPSDTMSLDRITDVEFKVFNRWGETVYESTDILEPWDGTHKGDPAPSEVYIWYVSYILDGQQMLDKGDVTLLR